MIGLGKLIGSGIGVVGSIFGGISASRQARKAKKRIESARAENQAWYNRRYNEDGTQRADAQRVLTTLQDNIRRRNQAAAGRSAVMGGTEESAAATRQQNNELMADATSRVAASAEGRKDRIEQQYLANDRAYNNQLAGIEQQQAAATSQAIGGVAQAGASIGSVFDDYDPLLKNTSVKI